MNIIYKEGIWIIGKQEQQTWWPRPFNISKSAAQGLCLPRLVQRNPKAHSRNCINREKEIYYGGKAHEKERNTLHANLKVFNHWQFFLSGRCLKPLNVATFSGCIASNLAPESQMSNYSAIIFCSDLLFFNLSGNLLVRKESCAYFCFLFHVRKITDKLINSSVYFWCCLSKYLSFSDNLYKPALLRK